MQENNRGFGKSVIEIIKGRTSVRTYNSEEIPDDVRRKLENYLQSVKGPFNAKTRYKLVDSTDLKKDKDIKLGTYGVIRGTTTFIASAAEKSEMSLEELGYTLEEIILHCTDLGLGTCWLGGTFNRGEFAKAIELKENEILPIVTPVGYPSKSKSIADSLLRFAAGSKNRKDWSELFFDGDFNKKLSKDKAGSYEISLEMVRLAPSASNKQPWRVIKEGEKFHFYLQHAKGYDNAHSYDIQKVDIGIAMCHFDLTAKEAGCRGKWLKTEQHALSVDGNVEYIVSWISE